MRDGFGVGFVSWEDVACESSIGKEENGLHLLARVVGRDVEVAGLVFRDVRIADEFEGVVVGDGGICAP